MEQPTDVSVECSIEHSAQNSIVFSHQFDSYNNEQSAGHSDQNECTYNDEVTNTTATTTPVAASNESSSPIATETSHSTKNSIIYFDDFNKKTSTILTPISKLALDVAWTKLGKYNMDETKHFEK